MKRGFLASLFISVGLMLLLAAGCGMRIPFLQQQEGSPQVRAALQEVRAKHAYANDYVYAAKEATIGWSIDHLGLENRDGDSLSEKVIVVEVSGSTNPTQGFDKISGQPVIPLNDGKYVETSVFRIRDNKNLFVRAYYGNETNPHWDQPRAVPSSEP
jgi:hypothetical protein